MDNPPWPQIDRELHVRKESAGLTLIKVAFDDGTRLEAVVADAGEMFLGLSVEMIRNPGLVPMLLSLCP